ncbi:MAG: hypothetical protein QOG43_3507 [Actinomycetota bacterium]|jgi:hypothetical protein|nr:hypothetical protein [Actinomycetota bacterium]
MQSCPECLAELRPDPAQMADALGITLADGFYPARPAGATPFALGPACTLLRVRPHSSLIFVDDEGFLEAHVEGADHRAVPPLACVTLAGDELFRVARYQAAADALVAHGPDGAALATFLRRRAGVNPVIDVRDETSAPVAALRPAPESAGHVLVLVETGGSAVARVTYGEYEKDGWIDDEWSLRPLVSLDRLPLQPSAAVALLLAAKMLLGRVTPARAPRPAGVDLDLLDEDEG